MPSFSPSEPHWTPWQYLIHVYISRSTQLDTRYKMFPNRRDLKFPPFLCQVHRVNDKFVIRSNQKIVTNFWNRYSLYQDEKNKWPRSLWKLYGSSEKVEIKGYVSWADVIIIVLWPNLYFMCLRNFFPHIFLSSFSEGTYFLCLLHMIEMLTIFSVKSSY